MAIIVVADFKNPNPNHNSFEEREDASPAQLTLLKVFKRILKVDEDMIEKIENDEDERIVGFWFGRVRFFGHEWVVSCGVRYFWWWVGCIM